MKAPIAALALFGTVAAGTAWAQSQSPSQAATPGNTPPKSPLYSNSGTSNARALSDSRVIPAASGLPEPTPASELKPPTVELPNEPIEPYLLAKDIGPFMVMARVFRGPEAQRMALALVKELRQEYRLPAFILRTKDFPGRSLIRGNPPTAFSEVQRPDIKMPEKIRTFDEAAVLVGNEKTLVDSEKLLREVRKIKPKCLEGMSSPLWWRSGLSYAYRTTNPYAPAQTLYPRTRDKLIVEMNKGLRNIVNCPGRYSLQVAEFTGRSAIQFGNQNLAAQLLPDLHKSPLQSAADDAETLAEKLAKSPDVLRLRQPVYVYHNRSSSKVFIGSFDSDRDPAAYEMREALLKLAVPLLKSTRNPKGLDSMIVPAGALTDLNDIKAQFHG
jgi:hypothetical protein